MRPASPAWSWRVHVGFWTCYFGTAVAAGVVGERVSAIFMGWFVSRVIGAWLLWPMHVALQMMFVVPAIVVAVAARPLLRRLGVVALATWVAPFVVPVAGFLVSVVIWLTCFLPNRAADERSMSAGFSRFAFDVASVGIFFLPFSWALGVAYLLALRFVLLRADAIALRSVPSGFPTAESSGRREADK